jgi:uncharacterized membrane protein YdjX (TVP38/TMEM64 family)
MSEYLVLVGVVLAVNLLPAFGPPTWAVLVWFTVSFDLHPVPLVVLGALAAATGRLVLALGARGYRKRCSETRLENLTAVATRLSGSRRKTATALGLFFLSPLPSGQLFVAVGLLSLRLAPIMLAFLAGRLVSYTIYVSAGTLARASLGDVVGETLRSPLGLALNLAMVLLVVVLLHLDWRHVGSQPPDGTAQQERGVRSPEPPPASR